MERDLENEKAKELRRNILSISQDPTLSPRTKGRKMQLLMSGSWFNNEEAAKVAANPLTPADLAPTFFNQENNILGCKHYQRGCKKRASCCGRYFTCRFCHDEVSNHAFPRHDTKEIMCMSCQTVQSVSKSCVKCGIVFGKYYCEICRFFDNDPKKDIYHCPHCGICRIGKGLDIDFFHCFKCGSCMSVRARQHKCLENRMHSNCPICNLDMFSSTSPVIFMTCRHAIHQKCFDEYIQHNYICPICSKSLREMDVESNVMDQIIANSPMPPEFASTTSFVLCNDCEQKNRVKFHYYGHKCSACGSYNTRIISTENYPYAPAAESTAPPTATGTESPVTRSTHDSDCVPPSTSGSAGNVEDEDDSADDDDSLD